LPFGKFVVSGAQMRRVFFVALMLVAASTANAYFDSGNALYARCQQEDMLNKGLCAAIITGAYDMMLLLGYKCRDHGITREQLRDVVFKYFVDNPQYRNGPAVFSVIQAAQDAFQCQRPDSTK